MTQIYIKQNIHKHQTQNIRRISHFGIIPVKKKKKKNTLVSWTIPSIYQYHFFFKYKKGMNRSNKKFKKLYKCITANTSAIWRHAAHTPDQVTSPSCYTEAYLLTKNIEEFSGKSSGERTSRRKKDKTERVTGLGRRTRE